MEPPTNQELADELANLQTRLSVIQALWERDFDTLDRRLRSRPTYGDIRRTFERAGIQIANQAVTAREHRSDES